MSKGFDPNAGIEEFDPNINAPTPQARVVINVQLSRDVIDQKKTGFANSAPMFPRDTDEMDFGIRPKEVLLTMTPRYMHVPHSKKREIQVFASLNGMFRKGDNIMRIYDSIRPFGLSVTECRYDPRAMFGNSKNGLPAQVHGSDAIRNTGPYSISAGDLVIFQIPNQKEPIVVPTNTGRRIVPWTVPYRPHDPTDKNHAFLAENFFYLLKDRRSPQDDFEAIERGPTVEGAKMFRESVLKAALLLIDEAIGTGILQVTDSFVANPDVMPEADTRAARLRYQPQRDAFLTRFYNSLQIESNDQRYIVKDRSMRDIAFDDLVDNVLFSRREEYAPFRRDIAVPLPKNRRIIDNAWSNWLEFGIQATEMVNHHFLNRGLGRAMTSAGPGEKFNIMMLQSLK